MRQGRETDQSTHEAILPEIEHRGVTDVCQRSEVMVRERLRNELIRNFVGDHVPGQTFFPLRQSVQFPPKVLALLRGDLGSLRFIR
jgi:hypothetical protein